MNDNANLQYTALYDECRDMVCRHSAPALNAHREAAYQTVSTTPLPNRKVEEYKYTDMQQLFAPDLGLNLQRLDIPVNP